MAFNPTSPITGAAITGLTSPTYTISADTAPSPNAKQFAVTALGGTQTGVSASVLSNQFTLTAFRPASIKLLPAVGTNGVLRAFPKNTFEFLIRKHVAVLANQPLQLATIRVSVSIPAGSDTYDSASLKAAWSCVVGMLNANAQALYDTLSTGSL
jgi:hypothetical protein